MESSKQRLQEFEKKETGYFKKEQEYIQKLNQTALERDVADANCQKHQKEIDALKGNLRDQQQRSRDVIEKEIERYLLLLLVN